MKLFTLVSLSLLGSASAYTMPTMATRAVGRKTAAKSATRTVAKKKVVAKKPLKKVATKKVVAKKPVRKVATKKVVAKKAPAAKKAPPASKGYPTFGAASKVAFNIKTSGKAPPRGYQQPNYADPRLQIERDPAVWAAAAKTRQAPLSGNAIEYVYEDGLTELERKQRTTLPAFLTGSAKSQIDETSIRDDVTADNLLFGLDPDRFQLLFITVFGLFTLIGCLSGTVQL